MLLPNPKTLPLGLQSFMLKMLSENVSLGVRVQVVLPSSFVLGSLGHIGSIVSVIDIHDLHLTVKDVLSSNDPHSGFTRRVVTKERV